MSPANALARTFLLGTAVALLAAWLAPGIGATGGALRSEQIAWYGVVFIFFVQGVQLSTAHFRESLFAWRLHLYIQVASLIAFPLLTFLLLVVAGGAVPPDVRLGFLFLAILPTTISSAAVLVNAAGGDLPSAIFNSALSNILAVFTVPLLCGWMLAAQSPIDIPAGPLLWKVAQLLLLPLVAGQVLRPWLAGFAARHKARLAQVNNLIIFFMVYAAFCDSLGTGAGILDLSTLLWSLGGSLVLLLASTWLAWRCSVRFPRAQRITALLCASQKTLASGVPLAGAIFAAAAGAQLPAPGAFLLPLICYHPLQLLLGSWLAGRLAGGGQSER